MPLSFVVFAGLVALVALVPVGLKTATFVMSRRRYLCPACNEKSLAMTGAAFATGDQNTTGKSSWTEFECERCTAKFVKPSGGMLMPRQAWIAGVQLPQAIVVKRED